MKRQLIFAGLVILIAVVCRAQTNAPDDVVSCKQQKHEPCDHIVSCLRPCELQINRRVESFVKTRYQAEPCS